MPRVYHVKKARKDHPGGIKKGDEYWWWKFRYPTRVMRSLTRPKRWQLTRSSFLSSLYQIENSIENISSLEDAESIVEELRSLGEEAQESLDNMPEHLQDTSESGMLLADRAERCEEWAYEIEDAISNADGDDSDDWCDRFIEEINEANPGIG